jgi:hypothetical protein
MNRKTSPTLALLLFTLTLAASAGLAGCAVSSDPADDTSRESSPVRGGQPPDPASLAPAGSASPYPLGPCQTDADCPGPCAGEEVLCCPVCDEHRYCSWACGPSGDHTPPSTRLRPAALAR